MKASKAVYNYKTMNTTSWANSISMSISPSDFNRLYTCTTVALPSQHNIDTRKEVRTS